MMLSTLFIIPTMTHVNEERICQHVILKSIKINQSRDDALRPFDPKEWQQKTRRIAANSARVSGPVHLSLQGKLFSSANCGLIE
jgi:hypothetical protein